MLNAFIVLLALIGFGVSLYIFIKKRQKHELVCFVGDQCNLVVRSEYSSVFGVPNELLGMLYHISVIIGIVLLATGTSVVMGIPLRTLLIIGGAGAAAFSLILIYIQGWVIHKWCEYCLVSAGASIGIFILELFL